MSKYRIAVLPGDGVGKEVVEAALIVLNKLAVDAEYVYGDIGWEFWCKEGNALPERTTRLLKETDVSLFGAITSKPKEDELADYESCPPICWLCLEVCPQKALDGTTVDQKICRAKSIIRNEKGYVLKGCNLCRRICPRVTGL